MVLSIYFLRPCLILYYNFFLLKINEGEVPKDRVALQMLAEEMNSWPNLEVLL